MLALYVSVGRSRCPTSPAGRIITINPVTAAITSTVWTAPDGYIAAIAAANGFTVATRDTGAFEAAGTAFINPWQT